MDEEAAKYISSLAFDRTLFEYDLLGSMAHVLMLQGEGIIPRGDASKILKALMGLHRAGPEALHLDPKYEDIHMAIEASVIERAGEAGGRMHTARSRNDQVALALRMWVRDELDGCISLICRLEGTLLHLAARHSGTVMPGYTHLQPAQPTTLAHHLLAHHDALMRDLDRLEDAYRRVDLNPLGSGALSTSSFPINRERTTALLGFGGVLENSMDAVSSRDFILEALAALAMTMVDMGRLVEELILWQSREFGFIELSNRFASTSSIMPQKKNPDVLEIARAKGGRVMGDLVSGLAIMRTLPYAYNRDMQELSPILADALSSTKDSVSILEKVLGSMEVRVGKLEEAAGGSFLTATELADLLVRKRGLPFRTAHQIVGRAVARSIRRGDGEFDASSLEEAAREVLGRRLGLDEKAVKRALSPRRAVEARKVLGGPSPPMVRAMATARKKALGIKRRALDERRARIEGSKKSLLKAAGGLIR